MAENELKEVMLRFEDNKLDHFKKCIKLIEDYGSKNIIDVTDEEIGVFLLEFSVYLVVNATRLNKVGIWTGINYMIQYIQKNMLENAAG